MMTDAGYPYDDDIVDQVFAVLPLPGNRFAVGSWTHSRNSKTGKISDSVVRYSINPETQQDRTEQLVGQAALSWERQICNSSRVLTAQSNGQNSKACQNISRQSKIIGGKAHSERMSLLKRIFQHGTNAESHCLL